MTFNIYYLCQLQTVVHKYVFMYLCTYICVYTYKYMCITCIYIYIYMHNVRINVPVYISQCFIRNNQYSMLYHLLQISRKHRTHSYFSFSKQDKIIFRLLLTNHMQAVNLQS